MNASGEMSGGIRLLGPLTGRGGQTIQFYADSANGDDGNDGRTIDSAFQTIGALETAALAYGDSVGVGLVAGSEWREELDLSSLSGVRIRGVGDLANDGLPKVRGDDIITGTWQDSTDRADANTEVWSISWTHSINTGQTGGGPNVWEDDGNLLEWQTSIAAVQANPGSFYHDGASSDDSPVTLYVHPSDSMTPQGRDFCATKRNWVIRAGANADVRYLWTMRQGHDDGSIRISNGYVGNCLMEDGVVHCALISYGTYKNCIAWRQAGGSYLGGFMMEAYTGDGSGLSVLWDTCICVGADSDMTGFGGHTDGVNFYDSWTLRDCAASFCIAGGNDVNQITVERLYLENANTGFTAEGTGAAISMTDVYVHWDDSSVTGRALDGFGASEVTIDGLRVYVGIPWGTIFLASSATSVSITNSVFVDSGGDALRNFVQVGSSCDITYDYNVIEGNVGINNGYTAFPTDTWSADNNVYFPNNGNNRMTRDSAPNTYNNPSLYYAAVQPGNEANSVSVDPDVNDPANGDFTLNGTGLPTGVGLQRDPTCQLYTPIPASLAAAEAWVIAA